MNKSGKTVRGRGEGGGAWMMMMMMMMMVVVVVVVMIVCRNRKKAPQTFFKLKDSLQSTRTHTHTHTHTHTLSSCTLISPVTYSPLLQRKGLHGVYADCIRLYGSLWY